MVVVADTSPIAALLHLNLIHLLNILYGQVFIPSGVAEELKSLVTFGYDISFLQEREKYIIRKASDTKFMQALGEQLDMGEAEAIALAKEIKADLLLIDERIGKDIAETHNINCKGVVGTLIEAKKQGLIQLIGPLLDDLVLNLKFRLSKKIYLLALKKADE
jgi:predicted nucleic acid-binding protein